MRCRKDDPELYFRLLSAHGIDYIVLMTSTSDQDGQAQPSVPAPESGRCTAGTVADPVPVLDERLEEKDLMFSIEVELHDDGGKVAGFKMERLLAEGLRDENRWRVIKGVQDLVAAAREATVLKLEAKLGPAPQSADEPQVGDG